MIQVGEPAPDFTARATDGRTLHLAELRGRPVVLYFFPKAFTPGCTAETRAFRDNYPELRALGAEVIGVSIDDLDTQCRFAGAQQVTFPMVGDRDRSISRAYGVLWPIVPVDKRVTFVIDEAGLVAAVFRHELQVLRHLDDVFHFLRKRREHTPPPR
jgi:peroxiredoxin Q/BCP